MTTGPQPVPFWREAEELGRAYRDAQAAEYRTKEPRPNRHSRRAAEAKQRRG